MRGARDVPLIGSRPLPNGPFLGSLSMLPIRRSLTWAKASGVVALLILVCVGFGGPDQPAAGKPGYPALIPAKPSTPQATSQAQKAEPKKTPSVEIKQPPAPAPISSSYPLLDEDQLAPIDLGT